MKKRKINMYSTFTELKASIVERFNRTIKNWMWTEFSFQGNRKWVNLIPTLLHRYNNRVHRSTGMKPEEVKKENEAVILRRLSANLAKHPERTPRFAINDRVRISRIRDPLMSKGYLPAWTNEQFIVVRIRKDDNVPTHRRCYRWLIVTVDGADIRCQRKLPLVQDEFLSYTSHYSALVSKNSHEIMQRDHNGEGPVGVHYRVRGKSRLVGIADSRVRCCIQICFAE
ncbi:unnamed protein product [Nesidiocoris tenuis]|uniref:Integrase catalytic domain-containing protein n=1 Tax=Nesidiocoris tenuis TaxID=355587 RepID=A0A6H5GB99_9HEMI|nr:unnamed protein product [Nesidiocoris tenuis]